MPVYFLMGDEPYYIDKLTDKFSKEIIAEDKREFNTGNETLQDLVKFQMFLLTTRDDSRNIKSGDFEFNWKDYFVNDQKLDSSKKNYQYENLVLEEDPILWGYKAVFYGRPSKKYKFHPEHLQEGKSELKLTQTV